MKALLSNCASAAVQHGVPRTIQTWRLTINERPKRERRKCRP
jgi:hypothetical protein